MTESPTPPVETQQCKICGVEQPKVPGPPSPPPYYCLKHREHATGKRCLDPKCPVCHPSEPELAEIRERHRYGDRQVDSDVRRLFGEIDWLRLELEKWKKVTNDAIRSYERKI